jgi:hypothetical protein
MRRSTDVSGWLEQITKLAVVETSARRAGSESMLGRLSELLFIELLRRHLETLPPDQTS